MVRLRIASLRGAPIVHMSRLRLQVHLVLSGLSCNLACWNLLEQTGRWSLCADMPCCFVFELRFQEGRLAI